MIRREKRRDEKDRREGECEEEEAERGSCAKLVAVQTLPINGSLPTRTVVAIVANGTTTEVPATAAAVALVKSGSPPWRQRPGRGPACARAEARERMSTRSPVVHERCWSRSMAEVLL